MGKLIQISNLTYTYTGMQGEQFKAIDNVSLTINSGEFVVIIGANGSGKSTLARQLNGLLIPTGGKCLINNMDTSCSENLWKIRQLVGMVFQNPDNQIVTSVVEEDIAFGPENLGLPAATIIQRVNDALELVDMTEYRYHSPHLLSGGQKQRISIAGILAMEPNCMVLDEATAMLDPIGRKEVLDTIYSLNRTQGITVIYVTHFMDEALKADRVIVMDGGRIVEDGRPAEIFSQFEKLKLLGLEVPLAAEIAYRLRSEGISLAGHIITDEELVEEICQLY